MTSTEFAAKYRLLKNVATRGARSFLAQQVELGRMVMVHYLDSETPEQQSAALARLGTLRGSAREKLLEIADVDGTPVAVTLFISSFVDFSTWLDAVSEPVPAASAPETPAVPPPGDFTRAFNKVAQPAPPPAPQAAPRPPASPAKAPQKTPGDFTRIFGKFDVPEAPAPTAQGDIADAPTLIVEAMKKPARQAEAPPAPIPSPAAPVAPPPSPATNDAAAGFTAIFGRIGETHLAADLPVTPAPAASFPSERVLPPAPPAAEFDRPAPPPAPRVDAAPQPGEFTQLFQKMSPANAPADFGSRPPFVPDADRRIDSSPRPDSPPMMAPPPSLVPSPTPSPSLAAPSFAPSSSAPPSLTPPSMAPPAVVPPVPSLGSVAPPAPSLSLGSLAPTPPAAAPGNLRPPGVMPLPNPSGTVPQPPAQTPRPAWGPPSGAPVLGGTFDGGVQSEYTRILGRVAVPPPPPVAVQAPAPNAAGAAQKPSKSMLPLIIALNVVILLTIAIVAYFIFRK